MERRILVNGESTRSIALQIGRGISHMALVRHRNHMTEAVSRAEADKALANASRNEDLIAFVTKLRGELAAILRRAKDAGDLRCAVLAIKELNRCTET